ncbi:MAG: hypothetical protein WKF35_13320 [Ferruginibacter sp.]
MTAVVGILNKQAVAIAADSAVTIGGSNGRKIFNSANKIFTLSKYHPVGVMIYNSAAFLSTPWETIIKIFRQQLQKTSYLTLKEYQEAFISYLRAKSSFCDEQDQKSYFFNFAFASISSVVGEIFSAHTELSNNATDENKAALMIHVKVKIEEYIEQFSDSANYCSDFIDYTFEEFEPFAEEGISEVIVQIFDAYTLIIDDDLKAKLKKLIFLYVKTKETFTSFTGIIFTGFGDLEIYPNLIPVNISLVIGTRIRYFVDEQKVVKISNFNSGAISPFAQTDVIDTILTGIDPNLDLTYRENFESSFTKYNATLLREIGDNNNPLKALIEGLDINKIVSEYNSKNQETKRALYIEPLMNAVSSLAKEDLAEMAESLIYLTYLKRRITFAEESVGGPVDVAIISKGDGFIWTKRKHYFNPELNKQFLHNYFNL